MVQPNTIRESQVVKPIRTILWDGQRLPEEPFLKYSGAFHLEQSAIVDALHRAYKHGLCIYRVLDYMVERGWVFQHEATWFKQRLYVYRVRGAFDKVQSVHHWVKLALESRCPLGGC